MLDGLSFVAVTVAAAATAADDDNSVPTTAAAATAAHRPWDVHWLVDWDVLVPEQQKNVTGLELNLNINYQKLKKKRA